MPEFEYAHFVPGSNCSGCSAVASAVSASVRLRFVYTSSTPFG